MLIGIISDTHGLLRPEAVSALREVDHILHAGDVGDPNILTELARLAPTIAIRGNIDTSGPCARLPATEIIDLGAKTFYILHDLKQFDLDPSAAGIDVVVSGHSHQPKIEWLKGILYINSGSAGPRRFSLPVSLVLLQIEGSELEPRLINLL